MTISENTGGTETTDGTEEILATISTPGVFVFAIDTSNLSLGNDLTVRVYVAVQDGDSRKLFLKRTFAQPQGDGVADSSGDGEVIKHSIPIPSPHSMRITLIGTGALAYDWAIYEL